MSHKLKITLQYTDPKIYRTVIVPENFNFHQLHIVIQYVMNWENAHMYQFNIEQAYASDSIVLPNPDGEGSEGLFGYRYERYDATKTYLSEFFNGQKKKMNYIYDLGDNWTHSISVLKKPSEEVLHPKCIKGENAAPIEDCGGIPGFYHIMETMKKKRKNAENREMLEWYGLSKNKSYDEVFGFDMDEVNQLLLDTFKN